MSGANTYPKPPPDRSERARTVAATKEELNDPGLTELRKGIILVMIGLLWEGRVVRDGNGRFRLTTTGVAYAEQLLDQVDSLH
jgi:hypothetical protein